MEPAALLALQGRAHDQVRDLDEIAELDEVRRHAEIAVIVGDFLPKQRDPVRRALQPLGGADDADIVPHEAPDLAPVVLDDDFLVGVGDAAFVPRADRRRGRQIVPARLDVRRRRLAEHEAFEQRVGCEPVRPVKSRLAHLPRGIKPRQVGAPVEVDHHAPAGVMLRGHHRDRLPRDVDAELQQPRMDRREMLLHELRRLVADVEVDIVEAEPLDLMVDRARHDVARRKFRALVEAGHEAFAGGRKLQEPALAAHRLGDQEVLDLQVVEAGRVELVELHVGDAAASAPGHSDPVARRPARRGRIEIGPPRAPARQDRRARGEQLDAPAGAVDGIDAVHASLARISLAVPAGDEVDRRHVGDQADIGIGLGRLLQRLLHGETGRVVDVDDPAVAVPALARQVPALADALVEGHAELGQPFDRRRRVLDHELHGGAVIEARARDHRVLDMLLEAVAFFEHGGDAALRPGGRSARDRALGEHAHPEAVGQVDRRRQPGRAGADDEHVEVVRVPAQAFPFSVWAELVEALSFLLAPENRKTGLRQAQPERCR